GLPLIGDGREFASSIPTFQGGSTDVWASIAADTVGEFVLGVWRPRIRLLSLPHLAQLPAKRPRREVADSIRNGGHRRIASELLSRIAARGARLARELADAVLDLLDVRGGDEADVDETAVPALGAILAPEDEVAGAVGVLGPGEDGQARGLEGSDHH